MLKQKNISFFSSSPTNRFILSELSFLAKVTIITIACDAVNRRITRMCMLVKNDMSAETGTYFLRVAENRLFLWQMFHIPSVGIYVLKIGMYVSNLGIYILRLGI